MSGLLAVATALVVVASAQGSPRLQTMAELRSGSYAPKRFSGPGIPGALAAATSSVDNKGVSIAFADGRFWYFVSLL